MDKIISRYNGEASDILTDYYSKIKYPIKRSAVLGDADYVYLIRNIISGLFKIGITNDYPKRFNALQTQSGCYLETVLVLELSIIDESARSIEEYLHKWFDKKRILGEWFRLNEKDIRQIEMLFYEIEGENIYTYDHPFTVERYKGRSAPANVVIG